MHVASMHTPKETPCVFVADGMIYALGSPLDNLTRFPALWGGTALGCFERYDPISDSWEVLPDPPHFISLESSVSVVGRRVFVAPLYIIFNLDSLEWDKQCNNAYRFPYGSLYAQGSLYYLRGKGAFNLGEFEDPKRFRLGEREPLKFVKRGPLPSPLPDDNHALLNSPCFLPHAEQIVAPSSQLVHPNIFFNHPSFQPWRYLFHMGGRFFCYVVTAQLIDWHSDTIDEPQSRGVWIKFFEEIEVPSQGQSRFCTLASFCYKINNTFESSDLWVRCCVLGSVPQSWIKDPPGNKVQESLLLRHKVSDVLKMNADEGDEPVKKDDTTGNGNLMELLTVVQPHFTNISRPSLSPPKLRSGTSDVGRPDF